MGTEERKKSPKMNVGSVSIVVIFVVLCLTVFAVLSFTAANSEKALAEKGAEAIENYYAADLACATAATDWQFFCYAAYEPAAGGISKVEAEAKKLGAETHMEGDVLYVHYAQPVDAAQELSILLAFRPEGMDILEWKVAATGSWEPEDSMVVWDGE